MDKEAIARIIDPQEWYNRDCYVEIMTASGGCTVSTINEIAEKRVSDSLAKATAILALQSRERGEGDGGPCAFDGKPCYVGGGTDDAHYRCGTSACPRSATLSPAEPSPESREGWQPIETLTKGDGYVLGWSGRSDDCGEREYFMGRLYDIRPGALLNEWTGRWRGATHWRPLPSPPASAIRALSAPAHD
jgi:hypothetical protein